MNLEDYVHRIGRTGRAGAKGMAFTFFTQASARFARELVKILQDAGQIVSPALASLARSSSGVTGGMHALAFLQLRYRRPIFDADCSFADFRFWTEFPVKRTRFWKSLSHIWA